MKPLLLLALFASAYAHDLYLMPQQFRAAAGARILLSAHTGDSFPNSEQGVDPARLTTFGVGQQPEWRILGKATHATVDVVAGSQYFAVSTRPKYLELGADAFAAYLKEEGLTQALRQVTGSRKNSREMYAKFGKTYVVAGNPSGNFARPMGLKIEFVPLADPALVQAGGKLPVQLLFDGQPQADVQVEIATSKDLRSKASFMIAGRTDAQGRIEVPIGQAGKVRLHAVHMLSVQALTHDWESYWASLTFEVLSAGPGESSNLTSR